MSTSLAAVQVWPSYGETQDPLVAPQLELWTTSVPSRLRIVSRVLQFLWTENLSCQYFRIMVILSTHPLIVIQCGNSSRLYPSCDPCAATVNPASSLVAVEVDGIPGGDGAGKAPPKKGWKAKARTQAARDMPIMVFLLANIDCFRLNCEYQLECVE